jgi:hypothetical protein
MDQYFPSMNTLFSYRFSWLYLQGADLVTSSIFQHFVTVIRGVASKGVMVVNSAFVGVTDSEFEKEIALNDTKQGQNIWMYNSLVVHIDSTKFDGTVFDKVRTYTN